MLVYLLSHICSKIIIPAGLDPAGPAFQGADDRRGLNINCATRVEAWHTDGKDSVNSYGKVTLTRLQCSVISHPLFINNHSH